MNLAKNRNQDGTLITLTQACQEFFDYIEKVYAE